MYERLWRRLPGPVWLRATLVSILFLSIVALCFVWVFPAIEPLMPFNNVTVDN